ncbi:MAG: PepSY domain-containing protein, partial [Acetobacteraceae bacterium]
MQKEQPMKTSLLMAGVAALAFSSGATLAQGDGAIANHMTTSMGTPTASPNYAAPRSAVIPGTPAEEKYSDRSVPTLPSAQNSLASHARLSMAQARQTALNVQPGQITAQELERENGGLRYSFDIKNGTATHEVGVDARTGRVLENSIEGKNAD